MVLQKLREHNLKLKPSKCEWFKEELTFVGHRVTRRGIKPDERNVEKIRKAKAPTTVREVRGFLGMAGYYRNFIRGFVDIARPLYNLTKNDQEWQWGENEQQAFETLKEKLTEAPVLAHPDFKKPFKLYTDASDTGLGAVLCQENEQGKDQVVAYAARSLHQAEKEYVTTEKECLAVVWAVEKFKQYIGGDIPFKLYTDHAALKTLMEHDKPSPKRARWMGELAKYQFSIEHRPGRKMEHADYLS